MKEYVSPKQMGYRLLLGMLTVSVSLAAGIPPASSGELQHPGSEETQASCNATTGERQDRGTASPSKEAATMRVHIDPETGEFVKPPAEGLPIEGSPLLREALSTSSEGLGETLSPTPGGGTMVDLQGRFRSPLIATQGTKGKLSIQHMPKGPDTPESE